MSNQRAIDSASLLGRFGWEKIGQEDQAIPVIFRNENVRYSPVRIVETEIIKKYSSLPQLIFQCITLKSYYLTLAEAKHLNNINFNHCNARYGESFFTSKDVIITAQDVKELSRFLNISQEIHFYGLNSLSPRFGALKILTEHPGSGSGKAVLAPYLTKAVEPEKTALKFVPKKLLERYVVSLDARHIEPTDWDIMYLKMLASNCEPMNRDYMLQMINKNDLLVSVDDLNYIKTKNKLVYAEHKTETSKK